ncbi:MAG: hypothetical protein KDM91_22745 [Verrucomicrobiae bacterium]|nr:hypothetical protein [Verrucomicrobiae bacterium]MCP5539000.1 hypothetical protein [Akkermansiaceae bacterium]MCP5550613.1 hypothetical protein [Akkermansiaceae bacterium]
MREDNGQCFLADEFPPFRMVIRPEVFGGEHLETANIASHLVPRFAKHLIASKSRIRIVGYGGPNFAPVYEGAWTSALRSWLLKPCLVDYFLQDPSESALSVLKDFLAEFPENFRVFVKARSEEVYTDQERVLLKRWIREHHVAADEPDQLWIERDHPPESTDAHDCFYFAPGQAGETADYHIFRKQFDELVSKSTRVSATDR